MDLGEPIAKGNTASIYKKDEKIIKLFNDFLPDTESEDEATKQKYVYSCGLPVPLVYETTNINGKQAIVMEYVAGKTIGEIIFEDMNNAQKYAGVIIRTNSKSLVNTGFSDSIPTCHL